ncbi:THAP domain-containing protein 2 [Orussus abietinus]|uniref:THAP domain-containing protein 2 n=1 Tax=Orussus abietinus TaxID=222816 RepID=UPI00062584D7|nr:THAP domain-containing protein 2 [Orussus abietinus]
MPSCSVKKCKNYCLRKGSAKRNKLELMGILKKVSYHKFPKDPVQRQNWARALRMETVRETFRVCSDHFPEDAFDRTSLAVVRLREHAVPIAVEDMADNNFTKETETSNLNTPKSPSLKKMYIQKSIGVQTEDKTISPRMKNVSRGTSVSPNRAFHSPTNEEMRRCYTKVIELLKKKNKLSLQRLRRAEKRVNCVKQIVGELRKRKFLVDD